jgi:hypothetical protein
VGRSRGPTITKRLKERAREEKRKQKSERRTQRKADPDETVEGAEAAAPDEDPDLAGIVPGPQPLPAEFYDDEDEETPDET